MAILAIAAVLRLYHLSAVPTELVADELDLYNSVRSIVTTGHDVDGSLKPFLYSKFTRNPPLYGVASYISSLVFGRTAFALRLPAAIFGLAAVVFIYGIALRLTNRRDIALFAALLQATQPIFVQFSRVAWEPSSELPFLLGGLYALICAIRPRLSFPGLALAAVLLGLTCYTYMAGWFYAALLGAAMIALSARAFRSANDWLKIGAAAVLWLVVAAPALWMFFFDPLTAGKTGRIATFENGVTLESLRVFAAAYAAHFRISYLVTTGDPQSGVTWRYLNGFGAFFWFVIPLAAAGLFANFQYVRENALRYWVPFWLAVYPLGGSLTNEGAPNAPRTLAGAPVFCLLAAFGAALFADWAAPRRRAVYAVLSAATLACAAIFSSFYFTQYVHRNSNAWDSGTRALFAAIRAHSRGNRRVCFSVHSGWYATDTYSRFYLSDVPLRWYDGIDWPQCALPGTLVAVDTDLTFSRAGLTQLALIRDVDGNRFALLFAREPR